MKRKIKGKRPIKTCPVCGVVLRKKRVDVTFEGTDEQACSFVCAEVVRLRLHVDKLARALERLLLKKSGLVSK